MYELDKCLTLDKPKKKQQQNPDSASEQEKLIWSEEFIYGDKMLAKPIVNAKRCFARRNISGKENTQLKINL